MTLFPIDRVMPRAQRASKLRGVHLAIVTNNSKDPENLGYGVKVKYPWLSETDETFWARIALPMAGPERGAYFLPEVDDQVLVVFEHGEADRPIVIGALWSKQQMPVEDNASGKNNTKVIKSRSGHRVIFDDTEGKEKVIVVDQTTKNKIVLDTKQKIVTVEADGDIEVKAADNVIMHSNALKMDFSGKLKIEAGKQLLAHAGSTFSFKAGGTLTVKGGQTQINVSNSPACKVSGAGSGNLAGVE